MFGLDKFANLLTDWPGYLAGWINDIVPGTGQDAMYAVGVTCSPSQASTTSPCGAEIPAGPAPSQWRGVPGGCADPAWQP